MADPGKDDDLLMALTRQAVDTALSGDIRRGLTMALEARHRARDAGDARAELAALNAAARCHSLRNDTIAALSVGIDAAALAQQLNDRQALAHALCAIANTAFILQLLDESVEIAARAVADAVALQDADLEARSRQVFGIILGDLKRFDEAREQLQLAVAAAKRDGRTALQLRVEGNFASLSRKEARHFAGIGDEVRKTAACDAALATASELLERARPQKLQALEMNMTSLAGEIHGLQGNLPDAIAETRLAIELANRIKVPSNIPPAVLRLAKYLQASGQLGEALEALQSGLAIAESLRPTFRVAELCDAIALIKEQQGETGAATSWRKQAEQERNLFTAERVKAAGYLRTLVTG